MYYLDSSAIIELLNLSKKGLKVLSLIENSSVVTGTINEYELLTEKDPKKKDDLINLLEKIEILSFCRLCASSSHAIREHLKQKGALINTQDILIAGTALRHNKKLITCDKDFTRIADLPIILI